MQHSGKDSFAPKLGRIYVEKAARNYGLTERILARYPDATRVFIDSYKSVLNRPRQRYRLQKQAPSIVLAKREPPYTFPLSSHCQDHGFKDALAASPVLNCLFSCDYCYLQGTYGSGHIFVFVNPDDFFDEIRELTEQRRGESQPLSLSVSLETDLLALEKETGLCASWIAFAESMGPRIVMELRTKSAAYDAISHLSPTENTILAWSLVPESIWKKYERGLPSPESRIKNARRAARDGWPIRLCFDPVLLDRRRPGEYDRLFEYTFTRIQPRTIESVSLGAFRMSEEQLAAMKRQRQDCDLLFDTPADEEALGKLAKKLASYVGKEKVFVWKMPS
ncbi:MAG: hypothetical protein GY854_26250 [Deltaproteobacteria bacterium]|nr:hypothetical protein [Deltaproteobacteria bacterium]